MFLQAGFSRRVHGMRIFAFVWHSRVRWQRARIAELVTFVDSGELAWWGAGGVSWGEALVFQNLVHVRFEFLACHLEQCRLDERRSG